MKSTLLSVIIFFTMLAAVRAQDDDDIINVFRMHQINFNSIQTELLAYMTLVDSLTAELEQKNEDMIFMIQLIDKKDELLSIFYLMVEELKEQLRAAQIELKRNGVNQKRRKHGKF